ncbi:hypothetical protein [Candidatus Vampirococcus lugosii]|uniref:N-acetyltransferase domain-containing protein n=1 Tax=Candidatus Vampirococcus lugosii TaxID=2789015 RepID=A0ABS5QMM5_9BACT|nr:hypothetical protein [Candidatus Vampirococcus lugosii]MBS8122443.1 hypothetical protein [Candidatus Vampirococcus lugosii]
MEFVEQDYYGDKILVSKGSELLDAEISDNIFALFSIENNGVWLKKLWVGKEYRCNGYAKSMIKNILSKYYNIEGQIEPIDDVSLDQLYQIYERLGAEFEGNIFAIRC